MLLMRTTNATATGAHPRMLPACLPPASCHPPVSGSLHFQQFIILKSHRTLASASATASASSWFSVSVFPLLFLSRPQDSLALLCCCSAFVLLCFHAAASAAASASAGTHFIWFLTVIDGSSRVLLCVVNKYYLPVFFSSESEVTLKPRKYLSQLENQ